MAVDINRQKELVADPKAIKQIEFVGQLKKLDANDDVTYAGGNDQSVFVLTILEKSQWNEIKTFSRKCNGITKDEKLSRSKS